MLRRIVKLTAIKPIITCLAVAFAALAAPSPSEAHTPLDTVAVLSSLSRPVLALDPESGDPHVAYVSNGSLYHAWKSAGLWQIEALADSMNASAYYNYFDLRIGPGGRAVALYVRRGTLVCAIRETGGWVGETLDDLPGPFYPIALAVSPVSGDAAVAWIRYTTAPETPSLVNYARRSGGAWTVQQIDAVSGTAATIALAIDRFDRPVVAWGRPRADNGSTMVLTCATGAGADGPFTAAPVDSELWLYISLALDPADGEPRIAYAAYTSYPTVRYAYRDAGGAWQWTQAFVDAGYIPPSVPTLALDALGDPFISFTRITAIEPARAGPAQPDDGEACPFVQTGVVLLYHRNGGAGLGAFQLIEDLSGLAQRDASCGPRALASSAPGIADVAWRSRDGSCLEALTYARTVTPVGVGDGPVPPTPAALVSPSPVRVGEALRVAFVLARAAEADLQLHDLSGRRVAARGAEWMDAGRQSIEWSPPALRPGLYWLTVRAKGERLDTRPLVVVR